MSEHNSIYGLHVIEGVLNKMAGCIIELVSVKSCVKIDGLGTFVPTVESTKNGIRVRTSSPRKWNASTYVKATIRFVPEGTGMMTLLGNFLTSVRSPPTGSRKRSTWTPEEFDKSKKVFV